MKVYELSKELNIDNKELLKALKDLGFENIKSHLSVLDDEQVQKIKDVIGGSVDQETEEINQEIKKPEIKKDINQQSISQWKPDLQRQIAIKNIARGKLVYKSKRVSGYQIEWAKTGDINYIELGEFINLKNSDRRFVTEPWIRVVEDDEIDILKYTQIFSYYKEILGLNNVSDILYLDFESFKKKFDKLPDGYKGTVTEHASKMIESGELDSIRIKNYIEKQMEIDLDLFTETTSKINNDYIDIK